MKLFMSFSTLITVIIIKIHKYLDMLVTDGVYWNNHTEYVSFQNQLIPELACFRAFCTKISTWYLILQKRIFTNTWVSFDRKAIEPVTIHTRYPSNSVLPSASSALPASWLQRQWRPASSELGMSGQSDSALPKCIHALGLIHTLPVRQTAPFAVPGRTTQLLCLRSSVGKFEKIQAFGGELWLETNVH